MRFAALPIVSFLLLASVAAAADPPAGASGSTTDPKDQKPVVTEEPKAAPPNATAPDAAAPNASRPAPGAPDAAETKAMADIQRIRARAKEVDPKENEATEKAFGETTAAVDAATAKKEKPEVAGRLAAEFGGAPELYLAEHERLKTGWGQLSIAHTILANTETTMTIDQIIGLRSEGLAWGQIAHGLDLKISEFAKTAHARARSVGGLPGDAANTERAEAKADPGAKGKADATAKEASAKAKPAASDAKGTAKATTK
jgi:hypothetical protein